MLLQQQLEKIMRKKKFSKLVSSCQYYCLLGTVHTTSSAGGFDYLFNLFLKLSGGCGNKTKMDIICKK